ncbi:hypothetical protein M501DRAFT_1001709 [Patellaria atrata CBS 101060]|uniref:SMP-30/Gluconolactonase/LRE-like region domain-containing protein n=1 Tax=Patellaria atrata CBS 101060 TaxID=1346257 RepID=A0A9P4SDP6_9PEZI|nr:hypothetical protein M501DRAFT_1001709 [Patellaria atrata CBS 101060]
MLFDIPFPKALTTLLYLLIFLPRISGIALPYSRAGKPAISPIYEFPNGTWVENIAVRSNGNLLVSLISTPELWEIDPFGPDRPKLLHEFPERHGLFGIIELSPDIFAVITGVFDLSDVSYTPGSSAVWKVVIKHGKKVSVEKITDVPEAGLLNGMTLVLKNPPTVLMSDSDLGSIWRLNTETKEYAQVLSDETMTWPPDVPSPIGINGVRKLNDYVYYVNFVKGLFCRVKVRKDGTAKGPYEVITDELSFPDDFALMQDGTAYIAGNPSNSVFRVTPGGEVTTIAGGANSTLFASTTSAAFGRTRKDRGTLYAVTGEGNVIGLEVKRL